MSVAYLNFPILLIQAVVYALVAGGTFLRRRRSLEARALRTYVGAALVWTIILITFELRWWPVWADARIWQAALEGGLAWRLLIYGVFGLAVFFLFFIRTFITGGRLGWAWWLLAGIWSSGLLVLEISPAVPERLIAIGGWVILRSNVAIPMAIVGWGLYTSKATLQIFAAARRSPSARLKNQVAYCTLALLLLTLSDIALISSVGVTGGSRLVGGVLRIAGTATLGYTLLVEHLPAFHRVNQMVLKYLAAVILALGGYTVGFMILQILLQRLPGYTSLLPAALLALILAILFEPLVKFSQRWVQRLFASKGYDSNRIVGEYSQSISNALDLKLIASVLIGIVHTALDASHAQLFLVEPEINPEGGRIVRLRGAGDPLENKAGQDLKRIAEPKTEADSIPLAIPLLDRGPIAAFFREERRALRQADLETQPIFRSASQPELSWLAGLHAELYIPICSKDDWIGLLTLGARETGEPYGEEDQALLSALANQTAVALQNTRLVEGLLRLNNEFRRAYTALELGNRQLERLERTKSDFISIASHELRTPLTLINGYSQMLFDEPPLHDHPAYSQMIAGIQSGAERLHEIVESLLDMALVDTRTLELHPELVSLASLISDICANFATAVSERRLQVKLVALDSLPLIEADLTALQKVFNHLIVNAIKFTPDGGEITITGRTCPDPNQPPTASGAPETAVEVAVADNGIGIDAQYHQLIFNKFYQTGEISLHSSGKTKFKGGGPGLGLAIVKGIIEVHNGQVWVESPGYDETVFPGSCFHVVLPQKQAGLRAIDHFERLRRYK